MASHPNGERDDDESRGDGERDPHAGRNRLRRRRHDVGGGRPEGEHSAHHGCSGDEAEIAGQVEHAGCDAPLVGSNVRHDGGVVGRLEQRIAGSDHDEWIYVLSGHMRFVLGDRDWVLGPGEVASFDTKVPHWFGSTGDEPAEILSIFGRPGERMTVQTTPP
jgi:hypothetical protein